MHEKALSLGAKSGETASAEMISAETFVVKKDDLLLAVMRPTRAENELWLYLHDNHAPFTKSEHVRTCPF